MQLDKIADRLSLAATGRRRFLIRTLGLAGLSVLACSRSGIAQSAAIKVGVLIPLSGPAGLFGASSQNCAQMAVDEINTGGGILGRQLEAVYVDVGVPPAEAAQSVLRLWKGGKAEAFIGMHDSAVRGALTNLFKGQVPYIYTPVYEGGECSAGTFVLGETPSQQLAPVIPWLAQEKGASKWYLIGNDYNWPRDTNAAAKQYISDSAGEVVGEEYLPFTADNFDSSLAKIRESGANAILITLVGGASVGFNRAFASFGLADRALRLGTLIEENTLAGIGAENSANLYSSAGYFASVETPAANAFAKRYSETFGGDAAVLNALGQSCYDGVLLLAALAGKAGSLVAADMDKISEGTTFESPRGALSMAGRHVARDIYLAQADGATFAVVNTFPNVAPGDNCA